MAVVVVAPPQPPSVRLHMLPLTGAGIRARTVLLVGKEVRVGAIRTSGVVAAVLPHEDRVAGGVSATHFPLG